MSSFDLVDAPQLILCFLEFKMGFEIVLPFSIRRESEALLVHTFRIELDKLLGDVLYGGTDPDFLLFCHSVPPRRWSFYGGVFPRTNVFGNQIQLCDRNIQGVVFGVTNFDIILYNTVHLKLVDPFKDTDSMCGMYHIITGRKARKAREISLLFLSFSFLAFAAINLPKEMSAKFASGNSKPAERLPEVTVTVPLARVEGLSSERREALTA